MPKKGEKKKRRHPQRERGGGGRPNEAQICLGGEVTVNDYANSQKPRNVFSKRTNMRTVVKEHAKEVQEDNRAWDEKDDDLEMVGFPEEFIEGNNKVRQKREDGKGNDLDATDGYIYPIDFWFLISDKILPEDVGRFAGICQATYYVVSTARFWFSLYKRCYSWTANLPEHLIYHNMDNIRGLRPAVIRSLFYTYNPFTTRVVREKPLSGHPANLIGAECISQWRTKIGSYQKYCFMFVKQVKRKRRSDKTQESSDFSMDSLVHLNPDEGCYILETISSGVCHVPVVMGNHLHSGHLGLSAGFCSHRLQLILGPAYLIPKNNSTSHPRYFATAETLQIILEPVRDVRIYPWWHPKYETSLPNKNFDDDCF